MKLKTIINILLILFFFSCFNSSISFALDTKEAAIKKIENEMQQCLDKGIAMHNCCYHAIDKYEIEIQKTLADFKKVLLSSQYQKLLLSQKKWEEYEISNIDMLNKTIGSGDGTILLTITGGYKVDIVKNRLKDLNEYYYFVIKHNKNKVH